MGKITVIPLVLVCVSVVLVGGCVNTQGTDPIVGTWMGVNSGYFTFAEDGQVTLYVGGETAYGNWIKKQDGQYIITNSDGSGPLSVHYNANGDYIVFDMAPNAHLQRFNAQSTSTVSLDPTVAQTRIPTTGVSTVIPTTASSPKWNPGDIVWHNDVSNRGLVGEIILGYDPISDKYATTTYFNDYNSRKWENGYASLDWNGWSRSVYDDYYYLITHVNLKKLKQENGTPYPIVTTPYPEYSDTNEKGLPKSGIYVQVDYDGSWSGTIYTQKSSRSVNGMFQEQFYIGEYGSACFSKQDRSSDLLQVRLIEDGDIVNFETTTNPYGIVCLSA